MESLSLLKPPGEGFWAKQVRAAAGSIITRNNRSEAGITLQTDEKRAKSGG
jgi:hypothetical protein